MLNSELITPNHRKRKAVIYIRQSTLHQVYNNTESALLQRSMREHVRSLGWPDRQIELVESDTGKSAQSSDHRPGYKNLLAEISLGEIGIVVSYESTRLARNCSDWYPLLDLCAHRGCLIADRDGVYDPSSPNGRLLLGMKGILSEVELHTLRGRLIAGLEKKAARGELAVSLPVGLVRLDHSTVVKEPDLQVQTVIALVFDSFLRLGSACKVLRHLRQNQIALPRRRTSEPTQWVSPTTGALRRILMNPAYAGAFVFGRTRRDAPTDLTQRRGNKIRSKREEWRVTVHDRYPAYISWDTFEQIQERLQNNYADYKKRFSEGVPHQGSALLQGIAYCGECAHKLVVQYKSHPRYLCDSRRRGEQGPVCQRIRAAAVDPFVVHAFMQAISTSELDVYERALEESQRRIAQVDAVGAQQLERLRYEARLAQRRYEQVDPDNRLVAGVLEKRWESSLEELERAQRDWNQKHSTQSAWAPIPADLKAAFSSLETSLPELWHKGELQLAQQKALLRCLIDKVILRREAADQVYLRIVWKGGASSVVNVRTTVGSLRAMTGYKQLEERVLALASEGKSDLAISEALTKEGFPSARSASIPTSTIQTIRLRNARPRRYKKERKPVVVGAVTVSQVAQILGVEKKWLYHLIRRGKVKVDRDPISGVFVMPDAPETFEALTQIRDSERDRVSCRRGHRDE